MIIPRGGAIFRAVTNPLKHNYLVASVLAVACAATTGCGGATGQSAKPPAPLPTAAAPAPEEEPVSEQ